jgi:hypothetical protein
VRQLSVLSLFFILAGCGGPGGTDISGEIKFGDGAPLSRGSVIVTNDKHTYRGVVMRDGKYEVVGVASGTYKVAIVGTTIEGEKEFDEMEWDQNKGEYVNAGKKATPPAELLAAKYSDSEASGLSVTVPSEKYDLTVESP